MVIEVHDDDDCDDDDDDGDDDDDVTFSPPPGASGNAQAAKRAKWPQETRRSPKSKERKTDSFFGVSEWGRGSRTAHLLKQHLG